MPRGHYPRKAQRAEAEVPPVVASAQPQSTDPLQRGRRIEDMTEFELRGYALQIGLSPRDANSLSVDRLRQVCMQQVYDLIDEL